MTDTTKTPGIRERIAVAIATAGIRDEYTKDRVAHEAECGDWDLQAQAASAVMIEALVSKKVINAACEAYAMHNTTAYGIGHPNQHSMEAALTAAADAIRKGEA